MTEGVKRVWLDVFGRRMVVEDLGKGWTAYWTGDEGKRRRAAFPIPSSLDANGIAEYLDDLFHEAASAENPRVRVLAGYVEDAH